VTVGAFLAHVSEYRLHVALRASDPFVHAAQRVLRGVVIEFRDRPDGLPTAQGVAVLTGNAETTVRTASVGGRLRLPGWRWSAGHQS
jgi:hypothetical protein